MAHLSIHLLGPLCVTLGGEPVSAFESDKVRALLAYLAAEAEVAHRREKLAGLLWPERTEASARNNLRHALAVLRQAVGDTSASRPAGSPVAAGAGAQSAPPHLLITPQAIRFDVESDAWIDAAAFVQLLQGSFPAREAPDSRLARLDQAVSLYRGDFLDGFSLPDSAAFDEWVLLNREHYRRLMSEALGRLVDGWEQNADYRRALQYTWQQIELDPWREEAHGQAMRLLALSGRRSEALAQYEACCRLLKQELGVEPAPETTDLYERIRNQEPGRRRARDRVPPSA